MWLTTALEAVSYGAAQVVQADAPQLAELRAAATLHMVLIFMLPHSRRDMQASSPRANRAYT